MPAISVQQVIAIIKGINFYPTPKQWYGVRPSDLFKPNLDLQPSGVQSPSYPYIPGTANPSPQTFTYATVLNPLNNTLNTVINSSGKTVLVVFNGGEINNTNGNGTTTVVEEGLHKTGLLIQKKIK